MTSLSNARTLLSAAYSNAIIVFSGAICITKQIIHSNSRNSYHTQTIELNHPKI